MSSGRKTNILWSNNPVYCVRHRDRQEPEAASRILCQSSWRGWQTFTAAAAGRLLRSLTLSDSNCPIAFATSRRDSPQPTRPCLARQTTSYR
ncbi:hypothetical protein ElyMa_002451500, partial [Elysia marginata]